MRSRSPATDAVEVACAEGSLTLRSLQRLVQAIETPFALLAVLAAAVVLVLRLEGVPALAPLFRRVLPFVVRRIPHLIWCREHDSGDASSLRTVACLEDQECYAAQATTLSPGTFEVKGDP